MPAKITFVSFFLLILISTQLLGQENEDWRLYKPHTSSQNSDSLNTRRSDLHIQTKIGTIKIIESDRIKTVNQLKKEHPSKSDGYRVQIYFGDRKNAQDKRGAFVRSNPDKGAYISYLAPNFRLRVGDFRTRLECEKFKQEIAREFPGCYIVKDKIELPSLVVDSGE